MELTKKQKQVKKDNRNYYLKNRKIIIIKSRIYNLANKENMRVWKREYFRAYKKLDKLKVNARNIAERNVPLTGKCVNCKINNATDRHHLDYSKPREVLLLCKICHSNIHTQLNSNGGD